MRPRLLCACALSVVWFGVLFCHLLAQEEPVGRLRVRVVAKEDGRPLKGAQVYWERKGTYDYHYFTIYRDDGVRVRRHVPAGDYAITSASTETHEWDGHISFSIEEGQETSVVLRLQQRAPYMGLSLGQRVYRPGEIIEMSCNVLSQVKGNMSFTAYAVDARAWLLGATQGGIGFDYNSASASSQHVKKIDATLQRLGRVVKQWSAPVEVGESWRDETLPLDRPGLYFVRAQMGDRVTYEYALITDLGIIVKHSPRGLLVYALSLSDSRTLKGARVEVFDGQKLIGAGATDASGLWQRADAHKGLGYLVFARTGDSVAWLRSSNHGGDWQSGYTAYLYTDRPIYRPKQTVHFKGIMRRHSTAVGNGRRAVPSLTYTVPAGKRVRVAARDVNSDVVYKGDFTLNEFGSFNGSFTLPESASLGNYDIRCTIDDKEVESTSFAIAEYRKPEFKVTVKTDRKRYVIGEPLRVTGNAQYYFGAPVAKAKVHYTVMRSPYWSYDSEIYGEYADYYDELNEDEGYFYGQEVDWGEAKTDEGGNFSFDVSTKRAYESESEDNYQYHVEVTVTDSAERTVNGSASALVTRGDFSLSLSPNAYVYKPKDTVTLKLSAKDFDNKPQAGVEVRVEVFEPGAKKYPSATGYKIRSDRRVVKQPSVHLARTDAQGEARVTFPVSRQGEWEVVATATDSRRHKITQTQYLWVASESFYDTAYNYPDLSLIPDKKIYNEGDTARVLINTSAKNVKAIVSLEGAQVYQYWLLPLKGGTQVVSVPIRRDYVPNVYLNVCFASGKHFVNQHALLKVSPKQRTLNVDIQPDQQRYRPRDAATYTVVVRDATGKPARAEVSLGLVDEAIYALKEDKKTDIVKAFYRPRHNAVQTHYSFPEIYLGGGKEDEVDVEKAARRDFRDTWYFAPVLVTDENGFAHLTVRVPDNLTTWRATVKAHTLNTSVGSAIHKVLVNKDLMVRLIAPRFFTQKDETTVSGVVHNETKQPLTVRVHLNAQGVKVLDNERTKIEVGAGKDEKVTWRVAVPKVGEAKLLVSAIAKLPVDAILESRYQLTPKSTIWDVTSSSPSTVNRQPSTLSDAMELTVPIQPHGVEQVIAQAGMAEESVDGVFNVPEGAIPEATKLQVRLSPSLSGPIFGALEYLTGYPYGCVEQTTSSFIPNVVVKSVLNQLQIPNPKSQIPNPKSGGRRFRDLSKYVNSGLQKLYGYQNQNGGWGWWENDEPDPYLTAYVMYAFALTQQVGYKVDADRAARGMEALRAQFNKVREWNERGIKRDPVREAESKSFVLFAYTQAMKAFGKTQDARRKTQDANQWFNELFLLRHKLSAYPLALLTMSAHDLGLKEQAAELAALLEKKATWDGDVCHWQSQAVRYDWMDNDVEATAYALKALLKVKPDSHTIVPTVLWLARQRRDGHWYSTKDTAAVVFALADYIGQSKELTPDETINVYVNNKLEKTLRFTAEDVMQPEVVLTFPRVGGRCTLRLEKVGSGRIYYGMALRTYIHQDPIEPLDKQGFRVERTYSVKDGKKWVAYKGQALKVNDAVRVNLKITAPHSYRYVMVEDMLPSGCEVKQEDREEFGYSYYGYTRREVRDNRVVFFFTNFYGTEKPPERLSYVFRPEHSGTLSALPTTAALMYQPEVRGHSREAKLVVK